MIMKRFIHSISILSALFLLASCSLHRSASIRTVAILGDSYSTFAGYIPEGNAIWYSSTPNGRNDLTSVDQTWWKQFCEDGDMNC